MVLVPSTVTVVSIFEYWIGKKCNYLLLISKFKRGQWWGVGQRFFRSFRNNFTSGNIILVYPDFFQPRVISLSLPLENQVFQFELVLFLSGIWNKFSMSIIMNLLLPDIFAPAKLSLFQVVFRKIIIILSLYVSAILPSRVLVKCHIMLVNDLEIQRKYK